MLKGKLRKIAAVYIALQVVIWVKSFAFFSLYGFGRVARFNRQFFSQDVILFDFLFHEAMHIGIGLLALWFGKNLKKLELLKLFAIVFIAVFLHNLAYWLTKSHKDILYSATDFASDSLILLAVIVVGYALGKKFSKKTVKSAQQNI